MVKKEKITKEPTILEFLITLNDNIVIQRLFNVKNYNPEARMSMDLYETFKDITEDLQRTLKMKTLRYMLDNYYEIEEDPSIMETSNTDGPEVFHVYLKEGDTSICHRVFDAKPYPPKARYTLDVRPQVKTILRDLTDIFSRKNLDRTYMEYSL